MLLHHSLRNGQAETVVLAFAVPGLIHPVKAVKEVFQLVLRDLIAGIDHAENGVMPMALQRDPDLTSGGMPDRVIQQNGYQLCELGLIPFWF